MDLKNSETYKNIKKAFAGESQAIVSYMFYAEIAKKSGKTKIAELFELMAKNEYAHAKVWYKLFSDSLDKKSIEHLKEAAYNENDEWKTIYPSCAKVAREEGFEEIAELFEKISSIEADHERRFIELLIAEEGENAEFKNLDKEKLEDYMQSLKYYCIFCGYSSENQENSCPFCKSSEPFILA